MTDDDTPPPSQFPQMLQERIERLRSALELMTEEELAGVINVAPTRLTVWRSKGDGPRYVKLGKQIFYRTSDVREWLIHNTFMPSPPNIVPKRLPALVNVRMTENGPVPLGTRLLTDEVTADG